MRTTTRIAATVLAAAALATVAPAADAACHHRPAPSAQWRHASQADRARASRIYRATVEGCQRDLEASYVGLTDRKVWHGTVRGLAVGVIVVPGRNLALTQYLPGTC